MKKRVANQTLVFLVLFSLLFYNCQEDNYDVGDKISHLKTVVFNMYSTDTINKDSFTGEILSQILKERF